MGYYDAGVFCMVQTLKQEKRVKRMGAAVAGVTHTVLLLGGGESGPLCMSLCSGGVSLYCY